MIEPPASDLTLTSSLLVVNSRPGLVARSRLTTPALAPLNEKSAIPSPSIKLARFVPSALPEMVDCANFEIAMAAELSMLAFEISP